MPGPSPLSLQDQLAADLATGEWIPYRRLPGATVGRPYYNPRTGNIVSEHYVLRVYRPQFSSLERRIALERSRRQGVISRQQRSSIQNTYLIKKASENPLMTRAQLVAQFGGEFSQLYDELRRNQILARHAPTGSSEREDFLSSSGRYAELLELTGRRVPGENFPVGMSPTPTGGYINTVVIPFYER